MTQNVSNTESAPDAAVRDGSGEMFDAIAARYDLLNRLMSFGVDQRWRTLTVEALELPDHARVLDQATGTADLAIRIAKRHPTSRVIGIDPSLKMLERGRAKLETLELSERIELRPGRAEQLDFPDAHFDALTIAFGIRNVPDRRAALAEMARVTKPGGRIAILELSEPRGGLIAPVARFHVHTLVPRLGAWLSGANEYRYLQRSIAAFPSASDFAALMEDCNLHVLDVKALTFGVCHLYVAEPKMATTRSNMGGA